jgi:8-oxo-dGTP diphosphatase
MDKAISKVYGGKVRVRACGLCWRGPALLMVNHCGLTQGDFWSPPGGGVEFGTHVNETLKQEFIEETGLLIEPGSFLFGCEFIQDPLHSIELFYEVREIGGKLKTGHDPELQIIERVAFMNFDEIKRIAATEVHGIFNRIQTPAELSSLRGFYTL